MCNSWLHWNSNTLALGSCGYVMIAYGITLVVKSWWMADERIGSPTVSALLFVYITMITSSVLILILIVVRNWSFCVVGWLVLSLAFLIPEFSLTLYVCLWILKPESSKSSGFLSFYVIRAIANICYIAGLITLLQKEKGEKKIAERNIMMIHNQSLQSIMKPEDLFVTQLKAQAKESHSQLFKVFCWWPKSKKKTTSTPTSIVYTASDFPMGMENFMPKREANYKFSENSVDSSYAAVSKVPRVFPSMVTPMSVVSSTLDLRPKLSSNGIYGDFQPALPPEFNNFTMQKRNSLISRKLWVYRPKTLTVKPSEIHAYTNEALDLEEHNFEPRTIIPCESDTPSKLLKIGQIEEVRTAF